MDRNLNDLVVYFIAIVVVLILSILLHGCTIRVISNPQYDIERERTQIIESYKQGHIDGITDTIDVFNLDEQNSIKNTY